MKPMDDFAASFSVNNTYLHILNIYILALMLLVASLGQYKMMP